MNNRHALKIKTTTAMTSGLTRLEAEAFALAKPMLHVYPDYGKLPRRPQIFDRETGITSTMGEMISPNVAMAERECVPLACRTSISVASDLSAL